MKFGYIDILKKAGFFKIKPDVYSFPEGFQLLIFPGKCRKKRLERAIKKYNVQLISDECSLSFLKELYYKIILQAVKEYGSESITFCCDRLLEYMDFFESLTQNEINFSLINSPQSSHITDIFLEKYGIPVKTVSKINSGLLVYMGGPIPEISAAALVLDLDGSYHSKKLSATEFFIKDSAFPIRITSPAILQVALLLTKKEIKNTVTKLCIISPGCE